MKKILFFFFALLFSLNILAKEDVNFSQKEIDTYQSQATQLLNYLEFTLNTVGSSTSTQKEKEIIINESFLKIFVGDKVQVEDDLDENRTVPTNKDIQAYLKDIDFFFREVEFKFTLQDVSYQVSDSNYLFFKFQINRNMRAKYFNGDTINTNKTRFIEINFDDENQDLKIASIYTTKLNEKEELQHWWNTMPEVWKRLFSKDRMLNDSVRLADIYYYSDSSFVVATDTNLVIEIDTFLAFNNDTIFVNELDTVRAITNDTTQFDSDQMYQHIKNFIAIQDLEIPDSLGITDLSPLSKLTNLRSLSISGSPVESLIPLRNLTKLEELDCQNTQVKTLTALRYSTNLKYLNFSNTLIWDLAPVAKFSFLERLYFNHTPIDDLLPLTKLEYIKDLRFAKSNVVNIDSLKHLKNIEVLNFTSTNVNSVEALSGLENLRILVMDSTRIQDLSPLENNPQLSKIYCDFSSIKAEEANRFMQVKPECIVIFESEELGSWWIGLDEVWKQIFRKYKELDDIPTTEQLHELPKIKIINVGNQPTLNTLEPLLKLTALEHLTCNNTAIIDLGPLSDLIDLKYLDARQTKVVNLFPLHKLDKLEYLYLSNTKVYELIYLSELNDLKELNIEYTSIATLEPISQLPQLKKVFADNTRVSLVEARKLGRLPSECLLIFRTRELRSWWRNLNNEWKKVFRETANIYSDPLSPEELHQISTLEKIDITNSLQIRNLSPLTTLSWLKELSFSGTRITQINALKKIKSLEHIECADNPINDLSAIMRLPMLKYLNISNIPIKDFEQIQNMRKLETLICPGTQVKNLKYLDSMKNLKHLEIYNTKVKNISPLEGLKLKVLKCYNTGINPKKIQAFKASNRNCEVTFY